MLCIKCKQTAWVEVRRHHSAFCRSHFLDYFDNQVLKAVREERMFTQDDRILVAISGGKDSLALWDVLLRHGYQADGLYIDLGIAEYSDHSRAKSEAFAAARDAALRVVELEQDYGHGVKGLAQHARRVPCSACGLSKRYLFNKVALEGGYRVVATGHNLDDEVATLLGNLLHWQMGYLSRQSPVLEATHPGLVKKVKPLFRLTEQETVSYAIIQGIDYVPEECPMAQGARSLVYKEVLNLLEKHSPGAKHNLLLGFLEKGRPVFREVDNTELRECEQCGQPTTTPVCAFCRMMDVVRLREREPRSGQRGRRPHAAAPSSEAVMTTADG
ncbi:MAG: TIGR00269 family protein [Chloroflexi bacterium]|nr:TIGR00269 family protein [Chloroflexota bacterium]